MYVDHLKYHLSTYWHLKFLAVFLHYSETHEFHKENLREKEKKRKKNLRYFVLHSYFTFCNIWVTSSSSPPHPPKNIFFFPLYHDFFSFPLHILLRRMALIFLWISYVPQNEFANLLLLGAVSYRAHFYGHLQINCCLTLPHLFQLYSLHC